MQSTLASHRVHAVDIGGGHITAAHIEVSGDGSRASVTARSHRAIDPHAPAEEILEGWAAVLRAVAEREPGSQGDAGTPGDSGAPGDADTPGAPGWAIAMPDPFDYERGRGDFTDVAKFENLAGVDIRGELASRVGVAPSGIRFVHDASAYGIGEYFYGEARGHDRGVCITLGTGVGSSFLQGGVPVRHRNDVPTNGTVHLLHTNGLPLEDTVSTRAITAAYQAVTGRSRTVKDIAEAAATGEAAANDVLGHAMRSLGSALAPWLAAFESTVLVVGGSMSKSWPVIGPTLHDGVGSIDPALAARLEFRASVLLDDAPLLGAAHWFLFG